MYMLLWEITDVVTCVILFAYILSIIDFLQFLLILAQQWLVCPPLGIRLEPINDKKLFGPTVRHMRLSYELIKNTDYNIHPAGINYENCDITCNFYNC